MKTLFPFILLCITTALPVFSQNGTSVDSSLRAIEALYNDARYIDAELEARRLREEPMMTDSAKVQIEQWIAFSLIAQGKTSAARDRFIMALNMDPEYDLDPVLTSPKILTVFNDARSKFNSIRRSLSDTAQSPVMQKRRMITHRTLLFPGLEQLHQGRTTAGSVFAGAGAAALGSGIAFEFLRSNARNEYLKATTASDISSKYDTYNTYRKAEIYSFIAFAVVYVVSEIDVFTEYASPSIALSPNQTPIGGSSLTVSIRF